jgi:hypothetical protein
MTAEEVEMSLRRKVVENFSVSIRPVISRGLA